MRKNIKEWAREAGQEMREHPQLSKRQAYVIAAQHMALKKARGRHMHAGHMIPHPISQRHPKHPRSRNGTQTSTNYYAPTKGVWWENGNKKTKNKKAAKSSFHKREVW
jgi:hypothetical protein